MGEGTPRSGSGSAPLDAKKAEGTRLHLGLRSLGIPFDADSSEPTEIVIGLVGPLGTDSGKIRQMIAERLSCYGYATQEIRISTLIIPVLAGIANIPPDNPRYEYANRLIDLGNEIRRETNNKAVLAIAAAAEIARRRIGPPQLSKKTAFIISSLKNPEEVAQLRKIYGGGFYLFAVHTDRGLRASYLASQGYGMALDLAWRLILRDEDEDDEFGQHTRNAFPLADFFLADEQNDDKLGASVARCLDLVFGNPHITPTFNEFAMFMAFASSLRSADLSRQVGAVVTRGHEILSTGANDCPRAGGGLYWPVFIGDRVDDLPRGRDYKRGFDSNAAERTKLIEKIARRLPAGMVDEVTEILRESELRDITEYGRMVHAEMEALLACARNNVSSKGGALYCTTFPCHNCAKHIIAAGIEEVIYVEPYPKSKALEFHDEAVSTEKPDGGPARVRFKPFIGVGPRQFFDLFSLSLSSGRALKRKAGDGSAVIWKEAEATPRVPMLAKSHRDFEEAAIDFLDMIKSNQEVPNGGIAK